jgi:hypothetical protein
MENGSEMKTNRGTVVPIVRHVGTARAHRRAPASRRTDGKNIAVLGEISLAGVGG